MVNENLWKSFRTDCIEAMDRFEKNEIEMAQTDAYLHKYEDSGINAELLQFIQNTISEIDADIEGYRETLRLLKTGASEEAVLQYMAQ